MTIERFDDSDEIKRNLAKSVVKSLSDYFEKDSDTTVSEAQMLAYSQVVEALPEGRIKEIAEKLKGVQGVSSKFNELMLNIQDTSWKIAKPLVVLKSPLSGMVPSEPFSKVAIKAAHLGSILGVKVITESVSLNQKIKDKLKELTKKKSK